MGAFGRGFRNRSPLVLVAAVALLVPALLGLQALFATGAWTAVPLKYWMRRASDDYVYVSWSVGWAKRHQGDLPAFYLLGGSTAREAITSGPGLAAEIEAAGGPACVAWDLGSMNQNFAQSLAVADNVPARRPAWIVIGLNLGRFTSDRGASMRQSEGRELLLKSTYLQRYVARAYGKYEHTYTILPGIFSYLTSYVQQHGATLLGGHLPTRTYGQHRYNLRSNHTDAQKERMVRRWNRRRYRAFERNLGFHLAMLEQVLVRARARGLHAVLLELPENRDLIGDRFDYAVRQYQEPVRALAEHYDVPYLDFNDEVDIPNGSFHDLSHLVEPGRVVWQSELARELAAVYRDETAGETL
jgi:hypothetical protein